MKALDGSPSVRLRRSLSRAAFSLLNEGGLLAIIDHLLNTHFSAEINKLKHIHM